MSGVKEAKIEILQSELSRLRAQAERVDLAETEKKLLEKGIQERERQISELERLIREQNERAIRFEQHLNTLSDGIREMEQRNHHRFQEQQKEYQQELQKTSQAQRSYMDQQYTDLSTRLNFEVQNTAQQIFNVQEQIDRDRQILTEKMESQQQDYLNRIEESAFLLKKNTDEQIQNLTNTIEEETNELRGEMKEQRKEYLNKIRDTAESLKQYTDDKIHHVNELIDEQGKVLRGELKDQRTDYINRIRSTADSLRQYTDKQIYHLNELINKETSLLHGELSQQRKDYLNRIRQSVELLKKYTDDNIHNMNELIQGQIKTIHGQLTDQRTEYYDLLNKQNTHFYQALQEQGQFLQKNIEQLAHVIESRMKNKLSIANEWKKALETQIAFIRNNYRHHIFAHGELQEIEKSLQDSAEYIQTDVLDAAILTLRNGYLSASKLREKLELMKTEWDNIYPLALENITNVLSMIDEHKNYNLIMKEFGKKEIPLDVDFWTKGGWSELRQHALYIKDKLYKEKDTLKIEDIKDIIKQSNLAREKLFALDSIAKTELIASHMRWKIQIQLREKLERKGYHLVEGTYGGEDYRQAYYMKFRGGNKEEIVTIVSPEKEGEILKNKISFNFYNDKSLNNTIRNERRLWISSCLNDTNMNTLNTVLPVQSVPGYENQNAPEKNRNFLQIRKNKLAIRQKQKSRI